jgi:aquaglyceroporin related protein
MLGYGHEVWSAGNYYFWIPMVAPFFGCTFGGFLYDMFIFTGSYILPLSQVGVRNWLTKCEGESPINTPWIGFKRILRLSRSKRVESHV